MAPGSSSGSGGSSRDSSCRGFVGEGGSSVAGEYHCADFTWESRVEEGEAAVARQLQERAAWLQQQQQEQQGGSPSASPQPNTQHPAAPASSGPALPSSSSSLAAAAAPINTPNATPTPASLSEHPHNNNSSSSSSSSGAPNPSPILNPALEGPPVSPSNNSHSHRPPSCASLPYDRSSWEGFHSTHSQARFFKERRYLLLEFPQLGVAHPAQHIVEVGCGCGSSLLPVLRANPTCRVTGCDISPTAVRLFLEAAERYGIDPHRVSAFAFDAAGIDDTARPSAANGSSSSSSSGTGTGSLGSAAASAPSPLAGLGADAALLIFTLSALLPEEMPAMLRHAWHALRPGGALLFRDYGHYDMAMLRFPGSQMLGADLYRRGDGTLAYFFTPEGLAALAAEAGFEVEECQYHCVALRNRKQGGQDMKRVFVHGVFRKPA